MDESVSFTQLEKALATVPADAVVICTPTAFHAPLARQAFQAGKHVLVEKGMTTNWQDAVALVAEAESCGVRFCVSQNYRYRPEIVTLHAAIASGDYGTPHLIDLVHHRYRPTPRTLDYHFAMVWDMSVHHLDNLVFCFGPVAEVTARSFTAPWSQYPHDAGISGVLHFASGAVATYAMSHIASLNDYRFVVQSAEGVLAWDGADWQWQATPAADFGKGQPPRPVPHAPAPSRSEQGVIDDFYRYIAGGVEPGISGRNNLEILRACEMLCRSSQEQRTVRRDDVR
ncbi:MAG: Gfo/Idh/MocA family oxidoreductase [Chloroflexota bacterium]|nr:Gfo/Idh/MocA family oxidoreductase [Chloroflexota bacterium]